ncbi:MAG: hypothetical protein CTY25_07195 [Methylobacterium sp.]|nr:MAG: hypothetical protein CTY25_07195 [Methylobacterium sp.]
MRPRIAIIGGGPTALFALQALISSDNPLSIEIFEQFGQIGPGMPYREGLNDPRMLANIASREMPPLRMPFAEWLREQDETFLSRFGIARDAIDEAAYYPRLALGAYFTAQLAEIVARGRALGHQIELSPHTRVTDVVPGDAGSAVRWQRKGRGGASVHDHVLIATGHDWDDPESAASGLLSPWPASRLRMLANRRIGIVGSSLSAIDVAVAIAAASGTFDTIDGRTIWSPGEHAGTFSVTMMSRNGMLPEADAYYPLPFDPLPSLTKERALEEGQSGQAGLLDRLFALLVDDLARLDPTYARAIDLKTRTVETYAAAHFAERLAVDPFVWAKRNLAEAERLNRQRRVTPWRYAILRAHEVFECVTAELSAADLARFHQHLKSVFTDNYASVPHRSIRRLLALHDAGRLEVERVEGEVGHLGQGAHFDAIVDARGQKPRKLAEIGLPTIARTARWSKRSGNDRFRLGFAQPMAGTIQCIAIPYLLRRYPFMQGLVNAHELGETAARCILAQAAARPARPSQVPEPPRGLAMAG